jgi:hypothetical protein
MVNPRHWEKWIGVTAFIAAVAASVAWIFVPAYNDGATVADENGASSTYPLLVIPALLAVIPLVTPGWRHGATVLSAWLLLGWCLLTGFTLGLFYWPSFVLMVLAAYAGAWARRAQIVP